MCLLLAALISIPAGAAELALPEELPELHLHGFVSQGFLLSSDNNYLARSSRGSFEFSEAGLNFTLPATDRLRLGLQLFSRKLGALGDYRATLDWYYLDYHWQDWLGIRAGRVKLPFGLYNDTADIDAGRTAVFLPQSVYPAQDQDFLLAQTGAEVYGYADLSKAGGIEYRAYAGTIFIDLKSTPGSPVSILDSNIPYVAGGRLLWITPIEGLRLGGSLQALRIDIHLLTPAPSTVLFRVPATLWVGSLEYAVRDLLLAAEYSEWNTRAQSSNTALIPSTPLTTSQRAYALATYRLKPWLQVGAYYSIFFPNVDKRGGRETRQNDAALTLRFDVNPWWLIKVEGHYMRGTAGLDPTLNDNNPLTALTNNWALLAVKTTAYF